MPESSPREPRPPEQIALGPVVLRRWQAADLDRLARAVSESIEQLREWLAWADEDRRTQAEFLTGSAQGWDAGERFEFAVEDPGAELLGSVGLMRRIGPGGLEIGYWVHSSQTGKGIAKLASAVVTDVAFALPWVDHVEIHHDKENGASGAVPAGLGFAMVEERLKPPVAASDTGVDLVWRLHRSEYEASTAYALLEGHRSAAQDRR